MHWVRFMSNGTQCLIRSLQLQGPTFPYWNLSLRQSTKRHIELDLQFGISGQYTPKIIYIGYILRSSWSSIYNFPFTVSCIEAKYCALRQAVYIIIVTLYNYNIYICLTYFLTHILDLVISLLDKTRFWITNHCQHITSGARSCCHEGQLLSKINEW